MTLEGIRSEAGVNGSSSAAHHLISGEYAAPTPDRTTGDIRVSVVIPARNEEKSLPDVLARMPAWVHEVILVDGLSVDDTSRVAKLCLPAIRIVEQTGRGKGNALREGFVHCTGDIVVALDADGSMDPGEIIRYVELLESGYDYVKGSRMLPGGSSADLTRMRRFGNWMFRTLTNVLTGSRYSDLCYGYFAFRRGTVDTLTLAADGFEIETEINIRSHKAGFRIAEVPSAETERQHGSSQLNAFRDGLRILATILRTSLGSRRELIDSASYERAISMRLDSVTSVPAAVPVRQRSGTIDSDSTTSIE